MGHIVTRSLRDPIFMPYSKKNADNLGPTTPTEYICDKKRHSRTENKNMKKEENVRVTSFLLGRKNWK